MLNVTDDPYKISALAATFAHALIRCLVIACREGGEGQRDREKAGSPWIQHSICLHHSVVGVGPGDVDGGGAHVRE